MPRKNPTLLIGLGRGASCCCEGRIASVVMLLGCFMGHDIYRATDFDILPLEDISTGLSPPG